MASEIRKPEMAGTPAPRYRDPFAEMRAEMDRAFDAFLGRSFFGRPALARAEARALVAPDMDIRENDQEIVLEAELPGMDEQDVAVVVKNGVLSLKGEKKSQRDESKDAWHLSERSYGAFERTFQLPEGIDEDNIKASFEKGVLRIAMPKLPDKTPAEKKIAIGKS